MAVNVGYQIFFGKGTNLVVQTSEFYTRLVFSGHYYEKLQTLSRTKLTAKSYIMLKIFISYI